jgi:type I restriction enzyme S subunit
MMADLLTRGLPGRHMRFKQTEIGEVPADWKVLTLVEVGDPERPISYGVLKPGPFTARGIPMLRILDIKGGVVSDHAWHLISEDLSRQYARTVLRGGETVISLVGTLGLVAHVRSDLQGANVHRNLGVVVPGANLDPEFLTLAMASPTFQTQVAATTKGGNQPLLNLGDLRECRVPVPSLEEQRAIVSVIRSLSARIDLEVGARAQALALKAALMSVLLTGAVRVRPYEDAA